MVIQIKALHYLICIADILASLIDPHLRSAVLWNWSGLIPLAGNSYFRKIRN